MVFEEVFGPKLVKNSGEEVKTQMLEGKHVLLYFSAHWCGPCRGFTPRLVEFYNKVKPKNPNMELVFLSSDRDQESFKGYFAEMPWLALPFEERETKEKLSKKYKVRGIPTLVVLGPDGKLITSDARTKVMQDREGESFPWIPPTLKEALGTTFVAGKGDEKVEKKLEGTVFGIYFSAHWCGPCRNFTPKLIEKYKELKDQGKNFEIIFVSSDRSEEQFAEYFGSMPWLAVPFGDKRQETLSELFGVEGIPTLAIIDEDLSVITSNGVMALHQDLPYPFRPPPLVELTGETASALNEEPCLIVFEDPAKEEELKALLRPIAEEYVAAKKGVCFFYATGHPLIPRIRAFAKVGDANPVILLLNIPDQVKFVSEKGEVTEANIRALVDGFLNASLTPQSLEH